jgi:Type I restriction modification DNA specificity domain
MTAVSSLFHIHKGHQLALNRVEQVSGPQEGVAYVARSHRNNGITAWVREIPNIAPAQPGDISVCLRSRNHSLAAFVQPRPFYTTYHVAILTPKIPMTLQEKLWWCLCIRANRFRFHFGRQANRTIGSLDLPDAVPEWARELELPEHKGSDAGEAAVVNTNEWQTFSLPNLFHLRVGEHAVRRDLERGSTPLVTASAWNNGISAHIADEGDWPGGQITVANNGSIGAAFYQPRPFSASRDVTVLDPKFPLTKAAALFVCTVLGKESALFNYARKWTVGRMRETKIRLPASQGSPDVKAMEELIRNVPLGWTLES